MKENKVMWVVVFLMFAFVWPGHAQQGEDKNTVNAIGVGARIQQSPYEGMDVQVMPVPIIKWRKDKIFFEGLKGGYVLYEDDVARMDVILTPRLSGYDADESNALAGMENRKHSLDAGLQFTYSLPALSDTDLTVTLLSDTLNEYKGQEGEIRLAKTFGGRFYQLIPVIGLQWQSKDLVDYYYGVRDVEVKGSRPEYKGDQTLNYIAGLGFNMGLSRSKDLFLVTRLDMTMFGEEIKKSSIVNKNMMVGGLVSVVWKF